MFYGGRSLHTRSHGETFFTLLDLKFRRKVLDEPEAALSPQWQLSFLILIHGFITNRATRPSHPITVVKKVKRDVWNLHRTKVAETQCLRTELHAGFSFSRIALQSKDESRIERNRANARKAYDALLRFIPEAIPSPEDTKEIDSQMAALKANLQQLSEDV